MMVSDFPTLGKPLVMPVSDERTESIRRRYPAMPPGNVLVLWWLEVKAKYRETIDFFVEADALGGRSGRGFVLDFLVLTDQPRPLDIEVQSDAFHNSPVHDEPVAIKVYDRVRRQVLEQNGYAVVWVSEAKLNDALDETMRRALAGQDVM